jgi:hypothetical protein
VTKKQLDFLVIGAQKAGTTSLFEYLRRHPELCLPKAKEVPFFSHEHIYVRGWEDYLGKILPFADPAAKWGTVTPHYMVGGLYQTTPNGTKPAADPGDERLVPRRIRELVPDVRLIAILRDPVQRARSHHAMAVMNGWDTRPFEQAVADLLEPDALEAARRTPEERTGYVVWGEYGRILGGYLELFPREQLLVLYTSELADDPTRTVQRVFEFLDVRADYVPDNLGTSYRTTAQQRRVPWLNLSAAQAAAAQSRTARRVWRALPERARRRANSAYDNMSYMTELWNRRTNRASGDNGARTGTADAEGVLSALRAHYADDAARLSALIGAPPPWTVA